MIVLPLDPEFWDYRNALAFLAKIYFEVILDLQISIAILKYSFLKCDYLNNCKNDLSQKINIGVISFTDR
jgi:hypothetical protein